ncbi:MAG: indolepyruvate ferredoxin oxidoreductase subunit alpha [Defluviitaleaceae bacterium]|nr:indolepyruvate ferredoxin oxidoreductase subunit alpha [Defluviitaleaceae bacterium]
MAKKLMQGNEAVARGVYEAGGHVVSSYPGTPSTEITEFISKYDEIYSEWAPNEKVALEVACGAAIGGARAFTAMKHVGLNVAADPLFSMSYIGANGGLVIAVADDQGMHSSQDEQDSRHYARAAKVPMLEPTSSAECLSYIKLAFELSEQHDTPMFVRLSTRISHSHSIVETSERKETQVKDYTKNMQKNVTMPAMARLMHKRVEERLIKFADYAETSGINTVEMNETKIGIITAGVAYQYAKEALPNASFLKLGMTFPMPVNMIKDFAAKVDKLYVIEELEPIIELHCKANGINVIGKDLFPLCGEINANMIRKLILGENTELFTLDQTAPIRPPVLCPSCPHRPVFYLLNKLKMAVTGDIGCYTLGALPPLDSMDTCICMGGAITVLHGMEKARGPEFAKKSVCVIGDSTFMHSGMTGLVNMVYASTSSTVMILDNAITGMTGHQHNPTTGFTIKDKPAPQVDLAELCKALGVKNVVTVDPFDIKKLEEVIKTETAREELSVIIAKSPCALLKSRPPQPAVKTDNEKCVGCRMCMKIGCPAISMNDKKMNVDSTICTGCKLCIQICKLGAISV